MTDQLRRIHESIVARLRTQNPGITFITREIDKPFRLVVWWRTNERDHNRIELPSTKTLWLFCSVKPKPDGRDYRVWNHHWPLSDELLLEKFAQALATLDVEF